MHVLCLPEAHEWYYLNAYILTQKNEKSFLLQSEKITLQETYAVHYLITTM